MELRDFRPPASCGQGARWEPEGRSSWSPDQEPQVPRAQMPRRSNRQTGPKTAYASALPSFADPPNDSLECLTHVDRISACRLVDPDHDQPASGSRAADHLVCAALLQVDLDAPSVRHNRRCLVE